VALIGTSQSSAPVLPIGLPIAKVFTTCLAVPNTQTFAGKTRVMVSQWFAFWAIAPSTPPKFR
jgi:hypothetical protein